MKTFHAPITENPIDCSVEIVEEGTDWRITIKFWHPSAFVTQFSLPKKEAVKGWHHPFGKRKWPPVFTMDDMVRVPRLSAAFLIRRALELKIMPGLPEQAALSLCVKKQRQSQKLLESNGGKRSPADS